MFQNEKNVTMIIVKNKGNLLPLCMCYLQIKYILSSLNRVISEIKKAKKEDQMLEMVLVVVSKDSLEQHREIAKENMIRIGKYQVYFKATYSTIQRLRNI